MNMNQVSLQLMTLNTNQKNIDHLFDIIFLTLSIISFTYSPLYNYILQKMLLSKVNCYLTPFTADHIEASVKILAERFLSDNQIWAVMGHDPKVVEEFMVNKVHQMLEWENELRQEGILAANGAVNYVVLDHNDEVVAVSLNFELSQYRRKQSQFSLPYFDILEKHGHQLEKYLDNVDIVPGKYMTSMFNSYKKTSNLNISPLMIDTTIAFASQGFKTMVNRCSSERALKYMLADGAQVVGEASVEVRGNNFPLYFVKWPLKTLDERKDQISLLSSLFSIHSENDNKEKMYISNRTYRLAPLTPNLVEISAHILAEMFISENKVWATLSPSLAEMEKFMTKKVNEMLKWEHQLKEEGVIREQDMLNFVYLDENDEVVAVWTNIELSQYLRKQSQVHFQTFSCIEEHAKDMEKCLQDVEVVPGKMVFGMFMGVCKRMLQQKVGSLLMIDISHKLASQGIQHLYGRCSSERSLRALSKDGVKVVAQASFNSKGKEIPLWFISYPTKTIQQRKAEVTQMQQNLGSDCAKTTTLIPPYHFWLCHGALTRQMQLICYEA